MSRLMCFKSLFFMTLVAGLMMGSCPPPAPPGPQPPPPGGWIATPKQKEKCTNNPGATVVTREDGCRARLGETLPSMCDALDDSVMYFGCKAEKAIKVDTCVCPEGSCWRVETTKCVKVQKCSDFAADKTVCNNHPSCLYVETGPDKQCVNKAFNCLEYDQYAAISQTACTADARCKFESGKCVSKTPDPGPVSLCRTLTASEFDTNSARARCELYAKGGNPAAAETQANCQSPSSTLDAFYCEWRQIDAAGTMGCDFKATIPDAQNDCKGLAKDACDAIADAHCIWAP